MSAAAKKKRGDVAELREAVDAMIARGPTIPAPSGQTTVREAARIVRTRALEFEQEIAMRIQEFTAFEGPIIRSVELTHEIRARWNPLMKRMQDFCEYTLHMEFRLPEDL